MRKREAARVLLFAPTGEILLMRFGIPRDGVEFVFWCAPGGEIEAGERPVEAARREIQEELGLELEMDGPFRVERNELLHQGEWRDNTDFYFVASCPREAPVLLGVTPDELKIMKEIRWWTLAEIEASGERVYPAGLAAWMRELAARSGGLSG